MPLPRSPLASLICPYTPFLAPRLLRISSPILAQSAPGFAGGASLQQRAYATKPNNLVRKPKVPHLSRRPLKKRDVLNERLPELERFMAACDSRNLSSIMDLYPTVAASPLLTRDDTRRLAQALHAYLRNRPKSSQQTANIFPFLERIVQDIRSGVLPSHPYASIHILGIYKDSRKYHEGYVFWQWLATQDSSAVDAAVYGAAIELLAYRGSSSLQELEELYRDALKLFPGTFAEYHLSPDAIIPDRTQPTAVTGIPIALLQGITTARILSRDWKSAYLALDTGLRLYPTSLPPRFFELFMTERPLSEGYTAFLMACRSGVVFKPNHLTVLIGRLTKALEKTTSLQNRAKVLQGMSNAIYAYLESGGSLEGPHIGAFLNAFSNLLPRTTYGEEHQGYDVKIRNTVVTSAHEMVSMLIQAGMPPHPEAFLALVRLAGSLQVPELLAVTIQDIDTSRADIGEIGRRNVLIAAGHLHDKELLERYWTRMSSEADTEGRPMKHSDWMTLARVCRRAGFRDFFEEQLRVMRHAITSDTESKAVAELDEEPEFAPPAGTITHASPERFAGIMREVQNQMRNVTAVIMAGHPLDLRKTPFSMFLDPERKPIAARSEMRAVYDEMTTDPHQPPPPVDSINVALSPTGIPLAELRFDNWATIVELMNEAEVTEKAFQERLDKAVASGRPLDAPHYVVSFSDDEGRNNPGSSLPAEEKSAHTSLRERIKNLRAPSQSAAKRYPGAVRKISTQELKGPSVAHRPAEVETPETSGLASRPAVRYFPSMQSPQPEPDSNSVASHRPLASRSLQKPPPLDKADEDVASMPNVVRVSRRQARNSPRWGTAALQSDETGLNTANDGDAGTRTL